MARGPVGGLFWVSARTCRACARGARPGTNTTMSESLSQFKALIFDVYGTLVNWESGILTALSPLLANPGQEWSKSDILFAYSTVESDLQLSRRSTQRGQLDTTAPDRAIVSGSGDPERGTETQSHTQIGSSSPDAIPSGQTQHSPAATAFAASLAQWPIFPDTPAALARLSALGLKLARQGGFAFDAVYTAEDVGSYKSLEREQILVVAQSLLHDHVPARALGLSSVWIDRPDAVTCIDGNEGAEGACGQRGIYKVEISGLERICGRGRGSTGQTLIRFLIQSLQR
ncbi:HAD-like domain-containing protein [Lactarius akahatsu]|uniref:HAD-like domain-containing protein n=1 Tax=Lactarius akahatsu TaxID=416441 RepID=A0AAD4LTG9_9AGAM|nr:HAD-like domain-containing protein [Lactarius akahatsu]